MQCWPAEGSLGNRCWHSCKVGNRQLWPKTLDQKCPKMAQLAQKQDSMMQDFTLRTPGDSSQLAGKRSCKKKCWEDLPLGEGLQFRWVQPAPLLDLAGSCKQKKGKKKAKSQIQLGWDCTPKYGSKLPEPRISNFNPAFQKKLVRISAAPPKMHRTTQICLKAFYVIFSPALNLFSLWCQHLQAIYGPFFLFCSLGQIFFSMSNFPVSWICSDML